MIKIQRPLCPELTFRLAHDISPDNYPDEDDLDLDLELQKEKFIFSCLAQAKIRTDNQTHSITKYTKKSVDNVESIADAFAKKLEWKQNQFEIINNEINRQHMSSSPTAYEENNNHINFLNNNIVREPARRPPSPPVNEKCKKKGTSCGSNHKLPRRPRKLPEIPKIKKLVPTSPTQPEINEKCLADELQEALTRDEDVSSDDSDDVFLPTSTKTVPKVYPKFSGNFLEELKTVKFNTVSKNTRAYLNSDNLYLKEDSCEANERGPTVCAASRRGRRDSSDGEGSRRKSCSLPATNYQDLEVTHRGMHRFVPRHPDEMHIEIGDPIHVFRTEDDLWCEGVNLNTNQRGIFPSMYATDLQFLEEEEEEDGNRKFYLRFLGSVEVNYHKGDDVLVQAINKVALSRRSAGHCELPPLCTLEVSQYGIRMFDKSKTGHENLDVFTHFFALKNISFCGFHPRNERYFAFITKHPREYRYACHVFLGEKSTRSVSDALGQAFKRFYQEYMAFTHPTEDIYME